MQTRTHLIFVVIFATGAACGWLVRRSAPRELSTTRAELAQAAAEDSAASADHSESPADLSRAAPPKHFADRLNATMSIGNRFKRARAVAAIGDGLSASEVRAALDGMAATGDFRHDGDDRPIAEQLFQRWGELDPQGALQYALTLPLARHWSVQAVVRGWAAEDAAAAEAWLKESAGVLQDAGRRGLVAAVADTDPKRAFSLLEGLTGWGDFSLAEVVFSRWMEEAPLEASAHAAQLRPGYLRDGAMEVVLKEWAARDGLAAVLWAQEQGAMAIEKDFPKGGRTVPFTADLATIALKISIEREPEAAADWLAKIPDEKKRHEQVVSLIGLTADEDPPRAAQLLTSMLPPGVARDAALDDLAFRWSRNDAHGVLAWAQKEADHTRRDLVLSALIKGTLPPTIAASAVEYLSDPEQRHAAYRKIAERWLGSDAPAAREWIAASPLPEHVKVQLLQKDAR